jgi:hypothetical protein
MGHMDLAARPAFAAHPRSRSFWLRLGTIAMIVPWALSFAVLCVLIYEGALHPPGQSALPANNWSYLTIAAFLLALPTSLCPGIALLTGWQYLRSLGLPGWRWKGAWIGAVAAGATAEALLVLAVADSLGTGGLSLARGNPDPLVLASGFLAAGAAMTAVVTIAARASRARSHPLL